MSTSLLAVARPPQGGPPVLRQVGDDASLTDQLLSPIVEGGRVWWMLFAISCAGVVVFGIAIYHLIDYGIGALGNNVPVAWGFPIINFVWWIGIGHAGTFISAFLLLLHQRWRASINRVAEAMTLFAIMNAGLFPVLHLGRPWFGYWLVPYPATMGVWPNFKSSLPWDVAAVSTYFTVSVLFWYVGLVPDLATARDRARSVLARRVYAIFALGWRGAGGQWFQYRIAYVLLAALATPLVISVHSVVSLDFAIAQLPGWHSSIFPPYFVVGAIYSGFATVLLLVIPIRRAYGLSHVITDRHLDMLGKLMLTTGVMITYSYIVELFIGWYSGDVYERYAQLIERPLGPYAVFFWIMIACNVGSPQLLWWRRCRRNTLVLFGCGLAVFVGMWLERFIIIVTSLNRDFLPSSWHLYVPTWTDAGLLGGSIGFFGFLFLLFLRFVPPISITEVKGLRNELRLQALRGGGGEGGAGSNA